MNVISNISFACLQRRCLFNYMRRSVFLLMTFHLHSMLYQECELPQTCVFGLLILTLWGGFFLHFITRKYIINCYFTAKKRSNNDWWPLNQDWWPLNRDSVYEWTVVWVTVIKCQLCVQEWVSDCCLTPTQQFFSYIMTGTS